MRKVAVLMSSNNGCQYIIQQIDSILAQEGVIAELYIRDDGSSDNTVNIIKEYCGNDLRVQFIEGDPLGVGRSFMTLLSLPIKADYYSFADRKVMNYLNEKLARWFRRKFKKLRHGYIGRARYTLTLTAWKNLNLFAHWTCGYRLYMKNVN